MAMVRNQIYVAAEGGKIAQITGLYVKCEPGQSPKEVIEVYNKTNIPLAFPLTIELRTDKSAIEPCGRLVIETLDDFPEQSVPCPCGDPKHWLVKIEKVEKAYEAS